MSVTPCTHMRSLRRGIANYERSVSGFRGGLKWAVSRYENALADAWRKDQETHAANAPAITSNIANRDRLIAIMKAAGIPDSYRAPDPKSRAWPQKHKTYEAGYLGDLKRTFVVGDGFQEAERLHTEHTKLIAEAKAKAEQEDAAVQRQAEADKAKRRADLALAAIIIRHDLPPETDWPEALTALRKRNKYLDLAVAGLQTRGDWSEGFYRVEDAMGRFTIESDQDKDIVADLCGCLRGDRDDGRIFRDTKWSYDKLFELVTDEQLMADAKTCLANVSE
jgi:hypothetical protein